jgi:hypothetical protein
LPFHDDDAEQLSGVAGQKWGIWGLIQIIVWLDLSELHHHRRFAP